MFSEWAGLVSTLRDLERRIDILQIHQDLDTDRDKSVVAVSTIGDLASRHYYRHEYADTAHTQRHAASKVMGGNGIELLLEVAQYN